MTPPDKVESKQGVSLLSYLEPEQVQCYDHIRSLVEEKDYYNEFAKKERFIRCIIEVSDPSDTAEFLIRRAFRFGILPADRDTTVSNLVSELETRLEEDRTKIGKSLEQVAKVNNSLLVLKILQDYASPLDVAVVLKDKIDSGDITFDNAADILVHMVLCPAHPAVITEKTKTVLKARLIYEILLNEDISQARKRLSSDDLALDMVAEILIGVAINPKYDISIREKATSLLYLENKLSKNDRDAFLAAFQMGEMDDIESFPLLLSTFDLPSDKTVPHIVEAIMKVADSYQALIRQEAKYSKELDLYEKELLAGKPNTPPLADRLESLGKYVENLGLCLKLIDPEGKQARSFIERRFKDGDEYARKAIAEAVTTLFSQEEAFQWLKRVVLDEDEGVFVKDAAFESLAFLASREQLAPEQMKWLLGYARASLKEASQLTPLLLTVFEDLIVPPLKEEVYDIMSELISARGTDEMTRIRAIVIMEDTKPEDEKAVALLLETAATTSSDGIFMAAIRAMGIIGKRLDRDEFDRLISVTRNRSVFCGKKAVGPRYAAVMYLNKIRPDGMEKLSFLTEGGPEFMPLVIDDSERAVLLAGPELRQDRNFALAQVGQNGRMLKYFGKFKGDREIVLAAVRQNGIAIEYADTSLKADPEIASAAVQNIYNAYALLPPERQKDPSIRALVIKKVRELASSPWPELALSDNAIQSEEDFVLAAVGVNEKLLKLADQKLLMGSDFLFKALNVNFNVVSMLDDRSSAKVWQYLIKQLHEDGRSFPPEIEESYKKFAEVLLVKYGIDVRRYRQISDVHEGFKAVKMQTAIPRDRGRIEM